MPLFDEPPLHDFPDRAIRKLLEDPHSGLCCRGDYGAGRAASASSCWRPLERARLMFPTGWR